MGEKPREEILVTPSWGILEFGDGYIAQMQGATTIENQDGTRVIEAIIKPEELMKKRYNIKDSELDTNGNLTFKMNFNDLVPLNLFDDAKRKWLYIKTFKYKETEISNIGWELRRRLEEERKKRIILEGNLIWYAEQLSLAKNNPVEFMGQGLELFNKMQESVANLMKKKEEEK